MRALIGKGSYGYGRGHRLLEIVGIAFFLTLVVSLGGRIAAGIDDAVDFIGVTASVATGYVLADFLSGMAHWAGDTLCDESTPMLGKHFVRPFRDHHVDPKGITRHDFIETNGNSSIMSVPILAVVWLFMPEQPGYVFYLGTMLVSAAAFVFLTNQIHKWAHADRAPRFVQFLQRYGLILSVEHHAIHHAPPHDKYYCITNGWMNAVLSKLRFFRLCEAAIGRVWPSLLHTAGRTQTGGGDERIA